MSVTGDGARELEPIGMKPIQSILTINGGSSSLKFALFPTRLPLERRLVGRVERVGNLGARLIVKNAAGQLCEDRTVECPDQRAAARIALEHAHRHAANTQISAIAHRVVHGGEHLVEPLPITAEILDQLRRIAPLDPTHLPGEIALIEEIARALPNAPQVACFDTAFHHDMPKSAQIVPIPRRYWGGGVRRYGFHGLSYTYLLDELARVADPVEAGGRVILAHLGSGASLAAVQGGRCIETTMGFSPTSGLVMGTRCGDIDPGLVAYLADTEGMTPARFYEMANRESGLLGVSETSADVRDLLSNRTTDIRAAEAVDLFCYKVKTWIGALTAALGGLDSLVFSGGIGENSHDIRGQACEGLAYLGISIDEQRNVSNHGLISADTSRIKVRVIATDEEVVLARAALQLGLV